MAGILTARINGAEAVRLDALNLSLTGVQLNNMQEDTASLAWTRRNALTLPPINDGQTVDIYLDARRIFHGRAKLNVVGGTGAEIMLRGPWSRFDDHYWQVTSATGSAIGGTGDGVWTSKMPMFGPGQTVVGGSVVTIPIITVKQQLEQILGYAKLMLSPEWLPGSGALPDGVRDLPPRNSVKRTVQDLRLSEAIRECLTSQPDAACWWDYEVDGLPVINFRAASEEDPLVLRVGPLDGLMDHRVDLLHELRATGVAVAYETAANPLTGRGLRTALDVWPLAAGATRQSGILLQTLPNLPTPIYGAARALYETLAVLRSSGSVTLHDPRFDRGLRPGMTLDIQGDATLAAEPVQHWVQSVSWSAATGESVLTVGYPQHLQLTEMLDLARFCRRALMGFRDAV